ncbi:TobH protein [Mycobacterium intermedium]|uniref:TobH protein n=1 Tax=Mycobacterium intermedium TaxID=28445 RepID=A0A1E3SFT8_MYCIE|nr:TobH protein [Mycobacterium intermedium]MCV6963643.1 TobH protein [Mycobacterium intermedium]ODR01019.1 TobH protein [Mycobacterium intermedium]OPE52466.1 TobH protein [Mycobacterium intermedium]ORB10432.1 TobH protein [Mycobacterium intermedium]
MSATQVVDLEDTEGLLAADRDALLRGASMAGAQVRAVAAAAAEGELDALRDSVVRSVIWVSGRGTAATAGVLLTSTLGAVAAQPIVLATEAPPWIGPLDVLVVAGDDPGDPALVGAAAVGVRRGARVVVVAPYEGPLRDSTAGRAAVLPPRLLVPDEFGLCRYLAAGVAVLQAVDSKLRIDLAALADELDAETLRNSAAREVFTNPAKSLAARVSDYRVALAGDSAATVALARHGSSMMLRIANEVVGAAGLADAVVALRTGSSGISAEQALFHDEELDGPLPERLRVLVLTLAGERTVVAARVAGLDAVDLITAEDVPEVPDTPGGLTASSGFPTQGGAGGAEQQLAVLAVRLEMAAVYLRLVRG